MTPSPDLICAVFAGSRLIARGSPSEVLPAMIAAEAAGEAPAAYDLGAGRMVEFDLRGGLEAALARLPAAPEPERRGPGRPRLGVAAREVTLLPRHWDWLSAQPGGASVALRKLTEAAMRDSQGPDRARRAREAAYRLMTAVAGDLPGYEDATRALFSGDWTAFDAAIAPWPEGLRSVMLEITDPAWRNGQGRP